VTPAACLARLRRLSTRPAAGSVVIAAAGSVLIAAVGLSLPAAANAAPAATAAASPAAAAAAPAARASLAAARTAPGLAAGFAGHGRAGPRRAGPGGVSALGAELAATATGRRLWGRAAGVRRPMASITKVMTALVVIGAGHLDRKIRISAAVPAYVRRYGAASAGLRAGDVLTARQLLAAMLLPSGCDAAYALATAYGPGWRAFVAKMNATARKLGLRSTHFDNFDGLPWPTERSTYSTPRDLVALGLAATRLALFRRLVRHRIYYLPATGQHHAYLWRTTNLLLGSYPGATGIKTGWTGAAGYCLLFEASRGGRTLIGVVLDASATNPDARFTAAARILDWGFDIAHGPLQLRPLPPGGNPD
jgi:D-alanyl-D-alanine carboxypeptidase (penicillin-binding protein 5/6)